MLLTLLRTQTHPRPVSMVLVVEDDPSVEPVTQEQVFEFFEDNVHRIRELLMALVPALPSPPTGCECEAAVGPLPG